MQHTVCCIRYAAYVLRYAAYHQYFGNVITTKLHQSFHGRLLGVRLGPKPGHHLSSTRTGPDLGTVSVRKRLIKPKWFHMDCVILSIVNCWLKNDSYDSMSGLASDWIILWFFFPWDKNCARLLRVVSVNHQKNLSLPPSSAQILLKWTKSPFPSKFEKSEIRDKNSSWPPFLKSIFLTYAFKSKNCQLLFS